MTSWFELNFTLRLLRKQLGYTCLCVSVIALGIMIAFPLVVFTKFTNAAKLPFANSERIVTVMEESLQGGAMPTSQRLDAYVISLLRQRALTLEALGAYKEISATLSDGDSAETFSATQLTESVLTITGVRPLLGRLIRPEDSRVGAPAVAVISYDLWNAYYLGDDNIIGKQSRVNGELFNIVGVLPEGFTYPYASDLWIPLYLPTSPEPGGEKSLNAVGLLAGGSSFSLADAEIKAILSPLAKDFPEFYSDKTAVVLHFTKIFNATVLPATGPLLIGLTLAVLLLVSFNVGNLLIIRSNERLSELAVRGAVGGAPLSIVLQVMLESLLIVVAAIVFGLLLGQSCMELLGLYYPEYFGDFPFWFSLNLQLQDALIMVACAGLIWLSAGFFPAWRASRLSLNNVLGSGQTQSLTFSRFTKLLVNLELVVSCFLLIISLAVATSIFSANKTELGVITDNLLIATVDLSSNSILENQAKVDYLDRLGVQLSGHTEISSAVATSAPPKVFAPSVSFGLEDRQLETEGRFPQAGLAWVSQNYFEILEANLVQGRFFNSQDRAGGVSAVLVDDKFAAQFWPDGSPIGKRVLLNPEGVAEALVIVGVVGHIPQGNPIGAPLSASTFYRPLGQLSVADISSQRPVTRFFIMANVPNLESMPPVSLEGIVKDTGSQVDRDIPLTNIMSFSELPSMQAFNLFASMMVTVSAVTLVLAIAGIYGVVSRTVQLRRKEIGIRLALGSSRADVITIFVRQASSYLVTSFIVGGTAAFLVLGILAEQIQSNHNSNAELRIMAAVFSGLGALVLLASYMPAKRMVAVEPGEALHYE